MVFLIKKRQSGITKTHVKTPGAEATGGITIYGRELFAGLGFVEKSKLY